MNRNRRIVRPSSEDERIKVPRPPAQRVSRSRVKLIKTSAVVAAVLLTVYDAYVSYQGFRLLGLPQHAPLVLASLILIVQLASGAIQQLGMNPFKGVGGSDLMDFIWTWVLASVYLIDVGSNAIAFGAGQYFSFGNLIRLDFDAYAMGLVILMLACLLTFGDEILLRLVDRMIVGARANEVSAHKAEIDLKAYNRYLKGYEARAVDQADRAGQAATVDFDWLKQGGVDD